MPFLPLASEEAQMIKACGDVVPIETGALGDVITDFEARQHCLEFIVTVLLNLGLKALTTSADCPCKRRFL